MDTSGKFRNNVVYLWRRIMSQSMIKGGQQMTPSLEAMSRVEEIEAHAEALLEECGDVDFPVDPILIARQLEIDVRVATFTDESISGAITNRGDSTTIYINREESPTRIRFTVAHEIGHYMLHLKDSTGSLIDRDVNLFRSSQGSGTSELARQEYEANRFAAALLMPRYAVFEEWHRLGQSSVSLARRFAVSPRAMRNRLRELGIG